MANEKRLIRMSDAIAKIVDTPSMVAEKVFDGEYGFVQNPGAILVDRQFEIIDRLEEVPEAEAVEVVHGRWENNHCTVCGMTPLGEELWDHLDIEPPRFELCMDYCPCCGADMR